MSIHDAEQVLYATAAFISAIVGLITLKLNANKNKQDAMQKTLNYTIEDRDYWRRRAIKAEKQLKKDEGDDKK